MSDDNPLLSAIKTAAEGHHTQATHHKVLHRSLCAASSILSVLIAITTAFDFSLLNIPSKNIATLFAIILPMVTSYMVLRSPEKLVFACDYAYTRHVSKRLARYNAKLSGSF